MLDLGNPRMFEAVVDALEAGVYLVDRDRKIVYWNHGAERISGYLRQQVTGRYCGDNILAHCDERETQLCGDACPLIDCMRDGQPREAAVYLRHRAGHRVPVYVRAIPLRDAAGTIVSAAEIFEEHHFVPESDRRQDELGKHGCLDESTALPNHELMVSYLREIQSALGTRNPVWRVCHPAEAVGDLSGGVRAGGVAGDSAGGGTHVEERAPPN